jgi:hypothetical protein
MIHLGAEGTLVRRTSLSVVVQRIRLYVEHLLARSFGHNQNLLRLNFLRV